MADILNCGSSKAVESAASNAGCSLSSAPPTVECGCCSTPTPPPPPPPATDCAPKVDLGALIPSVPTGPPAAPSLVPSGYGLVVMTALGSVMMVTWKSMKVGIARDEYCIPYPQMYTSDNVAFNCVLRAHQNTMESYPQFLMMLMIGGLEMPYFCTTGGCIWILGRIMYAKGYYTGDPTKRARGTMSIIGMIMLFAATTKFALKHLWG